MVILKEFIELDEVDEIQREVRSLNKRLLNALDETHKIKDLLARKNDILMKAAKCSSRLIPALKELNGFIEGDSPKKTREKTSSSKSSAKKKRGPGRPRKIKKKVRKKVKNEGSKKAKKNVGSGADSLTELKKNLEDLKKQLG